MSIALGYQSYVIPYASRNYTLFGESGRNINGVSNIKHLSVAEAIDPNPDLGCYND